jgi:hypothetical protein
MKKAPYVWDYNVIQTFQRPARSYWKSLETQSGEALLITLLLHVMCIAF